MRSTELQSPHLKKDFYGQKIWRRRTKNWSNFFFDVWDINAANVILKNENKGECRKCFPDFRFEMKNEVVGEGEPKIGQIFFLMFGI